MNISPDYLIERKRNKRNLAKWKIFSLLLILLLVFIGSSKFWPETNITANVVSTSSYVTSRSNYIASIQINEIIFDDIKRVRKLKEIAENDRIKAVIVNVNSPGGSVVGSEMLYDAFRYIASKKPIVVVMGSVAASGGYLAALGADYIIAHNGTITGSIGVIMQSAEVTELAEKIGVRFNNFKSSPLKAAPAISEKLTPEVKEAVMKNIYDVYDYFISLIAKRRKLDIEYIKKIADGRIYSGRQAFELKLIDAVGNEDTAVKWLQDKRSISKNLDVVDVKLRPRDKFIEMLLDDLDISISSMFIKSFQGLKSVL